MSDRRDDPRLTAWALGEREAPDALGEEERAEVDAIRAAAAEVEAALAAAPLPSLDPAHRESLEEAIREARGPAPVPVAAEPRAFTGLWVGLPAAAVLVLGLAVGTGANLDGLTVSYPSYSDPGLDGHLEVRFRAAENAEVRFQSSSMPLANGGAYNAGEGKGGQQPNSSVYGFGGGGGGGSHQYAGNTGGTGPYPSYSTWNGTGGVGGATGGIRPSSAATGNGNLFYSKGVAGGGGGGGGIALKSAGEIRARGQIIAGGRNPEEAKPPYYYGGAGGGGGGGSVGDFAFDTLAIGPDVHVTVVGSLPATLNSLRDVTVNHGVVIVDNTFQEPSTESYGVIVENAFVRPRGDAALSTFSIDVDTAAYSILRRCLMEQNRLPPPGVVRLEEMVNYFPYALNGPAGPEPFAVTVEGASAPWRPAHRLVRIALKGRIVEEAERPAANLVFLLDVSGSMNQPNKLPLVKQSIALLAGRLGARDRVALVVYAGNSGLVLPSTPGDRRDEILAALERLEAGGSTNGGAGIELAYQVAAENLVPGGINRVVLATDGDFNVGVTDQGSLVRLVEEKAKSKVFLTALGYGMDNLKDTTLESLADRGNGNYGYIDSVAEARKVLVDMGMSTLHCIAKDVKIQVEFNPAKVAAYRLLGYENRMLAAQDFQDDAKVAGEIGAGHSVTALYEVVPAGSAVPGAGVDELKYQPVVGDPGAAGEETLTVKLRWKEPEGDVSTPMAVAFADGGGAFDGASEDFRFAAAVAEFGMLLRDSEHRGEASFAAVREIAAGALGDDPGCWRHEFLGLVDRAAGLKR